MIMSGFRHESWSSRTGFALAAIGAAVGLGNIWKFPYMTGTNGGGAFVVIYIFAVVLVAVPILIAELMLGRRGHQSPPAAMRINAAVAGRSRWWSLVGWLGAMVGFVILAFYSVIGSWVLDYLAASLAGFHDTGPESAQARFESLLENPLRMTLWHALFMAITALVVSHGLNKGIERVAGILMPTLFIMLLALTVYAAFAGDFGAGLRFMFAVDFGAIDANVALLAIGQAFFSIGVSMGLMMAYGAYLTTDISIPRIAVVIAAADTGVSIVAGLAIFPLVFANALAPAGGPGLIFVTLPIAFSGMPAGTLFGGIFFLLLLFAAITSSIAILEPIVSWAEEHPRISLAKAAFLLASLAWALGIPSVLSFNAWRDIHPLSALPLVADKGFFDLFDYLTSSLMMPLGGMLIAIFVGWRMSKNALVKELAFKSPLLFKVWRFLIRSVVPLSIAALLWTGL
jgi:NSS family neurotransmitter:Na+ symporter